MCLYNYLTTAGKKRKLQLFSLADKESHKPRLATPPEFAEVSVQASLGYTYPLRQHFSTGTSEWSTLSLTLQVVVFHSKQTPPRQRWQTTTSSALSVTANLFAPALPLTGSGFKGWKFKAGLWCLYSLKVPTDYANSSPRVTRTIRIELLLRAGFLHPKRVLFPLPFLGQLSTFVGLLSTEIWGFLSYWVCFWICNYHIVLISLCVFNGIPLIPVCPVMPHFVLVRTLLPWHCWN